MKHLLYIRYIMVVALLILTLPLLAQQRVYDKQHPLIIAGDWDKPPFEYQNDKGEPAGFNIDVMRAIMEELDIPYQFMLKEWGNAIKSFEHGEADLILANSHRYRKIPYHHTHNVISYNHIRALTYGDSVPSLSIKQLVEGGVVLKPSDYTLAYFLAQDSDYINHIDFQSSKAAMFGVRDKDYKYFVWYEETLKWMIKELDAEHEGYILNEVDIPISKVHVIGRDKDLINSIDNAYSRLKQSGEIEEIDKKWLHPQASESTWQIPPSVYIVLCITLLTLLGYFLNRLALSQVKKASRKSTELNEMMLKALHMGRFYVMQYDIIHDAFTNSYGSFLPVKKMTLQEFVSHIHPSEQQEFLKKMDMMIKGDAQKTSINKRWNIGTTEHPQWLNISGHSVVEYDDNGRATFIINTINDITKNMVEQKTARELVNKYNRLSNMPQLSMSFYNRDGSFIDANDSMKALCEYDKLENEQFYRQTNMFSVPTFREVYPRGSEGDREACHKMEKLSGDNDTFIEFEIRPLLNENGEVFNYIVSAVDITEERERDSDMHKISREIQTAVEQVNRLEHQLQYILEKTDMYVWQLDFKSKQITFTRVLRTPERTMTFDEYVDLIAEDEKETAKKRLETPEVWAQTFSVNRHARISLVGDGDTERWYNISGFPIQDEKGNVTGVFGIIRDITEQLESQRILEEETQRAESSGQQKSMFLASMTHELRTPLNSIVGFSDLLRTIDDPEERKEFIRIIRTHCDILLRLINDIIEASNISGAQIQIIPKDVDFAKHFDDMCQALAQRVNHPNVTFIKKNPYTTLPTILDIGRIQQVITNFVTNAVKYTTDGHICVGYQLEERNGEQGLYVYCEDTGSGIPKEKQNAVFERFVKLNEFVQGTGLGLAICKNIIERCNGMIGVDSEVGKGSTFWFWIPTSFNANN